jgi:hypothetical protein
MQAVVRVNCRFVDLLLSASQIIVLHFYSTQMLALMCSENFLQYGQMYIFKFYFTTLQNETIRFRLPLGSLHIFY